MKIKAIVFGTTGMVGEGVLHECLNHPDVQEVLVINRHSCGVEHKKLREIIHTDFHDFSSIEDQMTGYNAAFFCLGVSSLGMKEADYRRVTYDLTMHVAGTLHRINPDMTFTYVSGEGTSGNENSRSMWVRIKSKTENDLLKLFPGAYMFRPGYIQPTRGLKNAYKIYRFLAPFYPVWKTLFPGHVCRLSELGQAMIKVAQTHPENHILENRDIKSVAAC